MGGGSSEEEAAENVVKETLVSLVRSLSASLEERIVKEDCSEVDREAGSGGGGGGM